MKKIAALLGIILLFMIGLAGWFYLGGTLRTGLYIQTAEASDYPDVFEAVRQILDKGSAPQVFADTDLGDISGYTLADITLTLDNRGLVAAEWLNLKVEGAPGDIAVYSLTGEGSDIAARQSGQMNLKLITTAGVDAVRRITVEYYTYGVKRQITVE